MTTRSASGTEIVLRSGDYEARIVTVGAGLAGLTYAGRDIVLPHSVDELPEGYLGKTLMPWPNRIADGVYTWEGTTHEVPVNEASTGAALHGLMTWVDWDVIHSDSDSATLGAFIAPRYGYPWALEAWVTYALDQTRGLSVTLHAKNIGTDPAPYGVSSHPYLTIGKARNDAYELSVPAATIVEVDENLAPVALRPAAELDRDYREAHALAGQQIDHAYTDLPEGEWTVSIRDPESGLNVGVTSDARWVQVYTGDSLDRIGVAVEPMTCPPNAFNSGTDVIVLAPGESHTLTFTIAASID